MMRAGFDDYTSKPFARRKSSSVWRATWVCAIRLWKEQEMGRTSKPGSVRREVCFTSAGCGRKTALCGNWLIRSPSQARDAGHTT